MSYRGILFFFNFYFITLHLLTCVYVIWATSPATGEFLKAQYRFTTVLLDLPYPLTRKSKKKKIPCKPDSNN
jgi:hypothetical protein